MVKQFKNLIFFSEISWQMTFQLGIQHQGIGPYHVSSNDDPRSTLLPNAFIWENASILDCIETIEVYELKIGTNS